jgi:hypothetical protein
MLTLLRPIRQSSAAACWAVTAGQSSKARALIGRSARTPESHDADVDPEIHQIDECVQQEIENHAAMVSLYFMYDNFGRGHQTVDVTPAMEARRCGSRLVD